MPLPRDRTASTVLAASLVLAVLAVGLRMEYSSAEADSDVVVAESPLPEISGLTLPKSRALLVFMSADCRYSVESAPFWKKLWPTASLGSGTSHTEVIAVTRDRRAKIDDYLADHAIVVDAVLTTDATVPGIPFVPMLVLADQAGMVLNRWIGLLDKATENQVLSVLAAPNPHPTGRITTRPP